MYLVVGLGNPDKKYLNTFHNIGFMVVDTLAKNLNVSFNKNECFSKTAHIWINNEEVIIAKPQTYMNLSGKAVGALCRKYIINQGKLIVVYDDVDVRIGHLRIRPHGSAGTHNGMRSIIYTLGRGDFPRIRIGIGQRTQMPLMDYVLAPVREVDHISLDPVIEDASDAIYDLICGVDIDRVMQKYNIRG